MAQDKLLQAARDALSCMRMAQKIQNAQMSNTKYDYDAVCNPLEAAIAEASQRPCTYCNGEGRVEMDNNGPIGECPVCKGVGRLASQRPSYEEVAGALRTMVNGYTTGELRAIRKLLARIEGSKS